jgi:hypothetical protein
MNIIPKTMFSVCANIGYNLKNVPIRVLGESIYCIIIPSHLKREKKEVKE